MAKWLVVSYGVSLISEAIELCQQSRGQDLEDTLQCLCAKKHECVYIVTEDKGFVDCGIEVVDYAQLLQ